MKTGPRRCGVVVAKGKCWSWYGLKSWSSRVGVFAGSRADTLAHPCRPLLIVESVNLVITRSRLGFTLILASHHLCVTAYRLSLLPISYSFGCVMLTKLSTQ
jgi:hypothetical protein